MTCKGTKLPVQVSIFIHVSNSICKMVLSSKKEIVTTGTKHKRKAAAEKYSEKEPASSKKKSTIRSAAKLPVLRIYQSVELFRTYCFSKRVMWHSSIHQPCLETISRLSGSTASSHY